MNSETKNYINLHLSLLKTAMKEEGLFFGIIIDMTDPDNSKLAFVDKDKYLKTGLTDGVSVSITELNKELL